MLNRAIFLAPSIIFILGLAACSEARKDPCQLLTVEDVKSVDDTVAEPIWAGRDGERKDDEVCVFQTSDGDGRLMLFVWYDKNEDPEKLVSKSAPDTGAELVDLPGIELKAAAAFSDKELKLLAVKSAQGVVGIRVRKPVKKDSADFNKVVKLAEKALSRN